MKRREPGCKTAAIAGWRSAFSTMLLANGQKMPNAPILDFVDDSVTPVAPQGNSFYNEDRMDAKIADKLVVRSGFGPKDTYVAFNLINEAGHGTEDATALVTLIDAYTPLLVNPAGLRGGEED